MSPFDYLKTINHTKENVIADSENPELAEKLYQPFLVNKGLSYTIDTVYLANEMNERHFLPKSLQYTYLLNTVRKRRRYAKWHKPEREEVLDMIMEHYQYSYDKARQVLHLFTDEEIKKIKKSKGIGGKNDNSKHGDDGGS